jgi:TonB family protein
MATPPLPARAPTAPTPPAKKQEKNQKSKDKVDRGELIEAPNPVYPMEAREQKIQGTVRVAIVIDEEGKVISAKAKSGPELLYRASQEAAYKARFKPAMVNGKPAEVAAALSYNFIIVRNHD